MKLYPRNEEPLSVNEKQEEYSASMRIHVETIVGVKDAAVLYEKFGTTNSIILADKYLLIEAGLSSRKADLLRSAVLLRQEPKDLHQQIRCSQDAFHVLSKHSDEPIEHFWMLLLNRQNLVQHKIHVSKGGLSGTVVDTKVIFHHALRYNLTNAIILAHNHPSGNLSPSQADIELTKKVVEGAKLLDIKVLDHIIMSGQNYLSFMDEGYL